MTIMVNLLTGRAETWWHQNRATLNTTQEFLTTLQERFKNKNEQHIWDEMKRLQQGNKSVRDYHDQLIDLAEMSDHMPDDELMCYFKQGLRSSISKK